MFTYRFSIVRLLIPGPPSHSLVLKSLSLSQVNAADKPRCRSSVFDDIAIPVIRSAPARALFPQSITSIL